MHDLLTKEGNMVERSELYLEKMRINERLSSLEVSTKLLENKIADLIERVDRHSKNQVDAMVKIGEVTNKIHHTVYGNGVPGHDEKIRNLEGFKKHIIAMWVAIVAWIGQFILSFFTKH